MELNDVIKALECCAAPVMNCDECPVDEKKKDVCECGTYLAGEALKVIRKRTDENEAWQKLLITTEEKSSKAYYDLACEVENLRTENERLKAQRYVAYSDGRIEMIPTVESVRSDTVREMQERLKETPIKVGLPLFGLQTKGEVQDYAYGLISQMVDVIDQIAKEMLEEERSRIAEAKERLSAEKEIIFINKIICESVIHGADRGGSYNSNENDLTEAINEWLKYKKLDHLFCVKLRDVRKDFGYCLEIWNIPQICEKNRDKEG